MRRNSSPEPVRSTRFFSFLQRWSHLVAAEGYLLFSIGLFAFGPWFWPINNPAGLYTYLLLGCAALAVGFVANRSSPRSVPLPIRRVDLLILVTSLLSTVLLVGAYVVASRSLPSLLESVVDPAGAYLASHAAEDVNWAEQLRTLASPVTALALPAGVFLWRVLRWRTRAGVTLAFIAELLYGLSSGTNQGVACPLITVLAAYLIGNLAFHEPGKQNRRIRWVVHSVFLAVILIGSFGYNLDTRRGDVSIKDYGAFAGPALGIRPDTSHIIFTETPEWFQKFSLNLGHYLGIGYFGLSLCLEQDFKWVYGVGHSRAILGYLDQYAHIDLFSETYMGRVEAATGYPDGIAWHSIYAALASDLTFPGALLAMVVIGYLFAQLAAETIRNKSILAVTLYCKMWLVIGFVPMVNYVAVNRAQYLAFLGVTVFWLISKLRRRIPTPRARPQGTTAVVSPVAEGVQTIAGTEASI